MDENYPSLVSCKPLKLEHQRLQKININKDTFSIGRALHNSLVLPILAISRNHCVIKKTNDDWIIEDSSSFGIEVNGQKLGKGMKRKLSHKDIIKLEPTEEFLYEYDHGAYEPQEKRIKLDSSASENNIVDNVKSKFEESQSYAIQHLEAKIQNAKQMQTTSKILKNQLTQDMNRKIQQLENEFAVQIYNLKGEKQEVEKQKALLIEERDLQLSNVKKIMEERIEKLMEEIRKHNETESELLKENNILKEKLEEERKQFLSELSKESSSKQDILEKLEARVREQEEARLKEKQHLENLLKTETEQLRLSKEKELQELENQKKQKEFELEQKLSEIKKNLEQQVQQAELEKLKSEQQLNQQVDEMRKLSAEEKAKMEMLVNEREEIKKRLTEEQVKAERSLEELRTQVAQRETELAAIAAERIQKQAEQSTVVITALQEQLETVRSQLLSVESEKNVLLESICGPTTSETQDTECKRSTLEHMGELMESELQCSICAELFVAATTLNCSHTFCKYCINTWKKKKKDCPICRCPITSECKSLVLDTFIEKMVNSLTDEMKNKRLQMLKSREAEETATTTSRQLKSGTRGRSGTTGSGRRRRRNTTMSNTSMIQEADLTTNPRSSNFTMNPAVTVDLTWIELPPQTRP